MARLALECMPRLRGSEGKNLTDVSLELLAAVSRFGPVVGQPWVPVFRETRGLSRFQTECVPPEMEPQGGCGRTDRSSTGSCASLRLGVAARPPPGISPGPFLLVEHGWEHVSLPGRSR